MSKAKSHGARIAVLEQQVIDQKEATVVALAAADKAIMNAYGTAEKAVAKVELAAEKSYLESQIAALRDTFLQQIANSDKAVLKAETATERRFEGVNEFRAALNDQARSMMPRAEFDVQTRSISERMQLQTKRLEDLQLQQSTYAAQNVGKQMGFGFIGSVVMGGVAVVSATAAVVSFLTHFPK